MGEDRPHPLDVLGAATGHDRQAARLGARGAAGYRRVDPAYAGAGFQFGGHFPRGGRFQAGEVHQQLAGAGALDDAARAEHHFAHRSGVGQAEHHHLRASAQFGGTDDSLRAFGGEQLALASGAVPDAQRVAGSEQAARHGHAHQAEAGECD
ncbi:hypothetical protein D3C76_1019120 [compost metagenome]